MSVLPKRASAWQRRLFAVASVWMTVAAAAESTAASRSAVKAPECPAAGSRVVGFARVIDGGGFLTADGEEVRLSGILAPGAGGDAVSGTAAGAARDALTLALRDGSVALAPAEPQRDRYGRIIAQVFADGTWVQAALLQGGE